MEEVGRQVAKVARKWQIGYSTLEDRVQEGWKLCLEALPSYRESKGELGAFLYIHLVNRFRNWLRDEVCRYQPPCKRCATGEMCEPGGCVAHQDWQKLNDRKASLRRPSVDGRCEFPYEGPDPLEVEEARKVALGTLSGRLRLDYLRMVDGSPVPAARRAVVERAVLEALCARED